MDPLKTARGPPGQEKNLRALVEAPGTLCAAPRGAQGGTGGPRGAQGGGTGGIPQLLLHVPTNIDGFLEMLLWPLFRAVFFFSKPDLNWAARGR